MVNALLVAVSELDMDPKSLAKGSVDLGDGFILMRKCNKVPKFPTAEVAQSIRQFLRLDYQIIHIHHWARLLLPNGQVVRTLWREELKDASQLRVSCNVKVHVFLS